MMKYISTEVLIFLTVGTLAMLIQMLLRYKRYSVAGWKIPLVSVMLTIAGTIGTMLMFYFENGRIGGRSFFGAVFLVPVLMLPVGLVLRISFGTLMDLCAPAECAMLMIMKIDCIIQGCCEGKILFTTKEGFSVRFPSQIVETILAAIVMCVLLVLEKKGKNRGKLYLFYLVFYGGTRFIANWFRAGLSPFIWRLPAGNFWGLCSVVLGGTGLLIFYLIKQNKMKRC